MAATKATTTLKELSERIKSHLKRFEEDVKINAMRPDFENTRPYYFAHASVAGRYVHVQYISYQGGSHLSKAEAEMYLRWLDAGNVGRHHEAFRAMETKKKAHAR